MAGYSVYPEVPESNTYINDIVLVVASVELSDLYIGGGGVTCGYGIAQRLVTATLGAKYRVKSLLAEERADIVIGQIWLRHCLARILRVGSIEFLYLR